jgi:Lon protease-like protein
MSEVSHQISEPHPYSLKPEDLPDTLPVFVLPSVLLLPRGRLPLNIFEPRYRAMIDDALGSSTRMVGIVQEKEKSASTNEENPELYSVGCAGRIMSFSETDKGTYIISVHGLSRFGVGTEQGMVKGYRRITPIWTPYIDDMTEPPHGVVERGRLFNALRHYFKVHGIMANWDVIQETPDENLVISLAMTCPFAPWEHQALLEASSLAERARLLLTLIEMATLDHGNDASIRH